MLKPYNEIADEFNLGRMLQALNDACGTGKRLPLHQMQEIRSFVEQVHATKWAIAEKRIEFDQNVTALRNVRRHFEGG